ncbi:MAG: TetR family transcriptional regulator [Streptosporangiaceae bacterium]|nr:TetR family transcriptional regulator [Streptosporangiaceae bacterium]
MIEVAAPRRERKKQQTRGALIRAAMELFEAKGYDHTAVREITDAVDVSERTFFRYFASKEDLALSFIRDMTGVLLRALAARPPEEDPLTALRRAFRESLRVVSPGEGGHTADVLAIIRLIESTPSLLAAHLRYLHDNDNEMVRVLADREGIDPADPRPWILAAVFGGLVSLANREWKTHGVGGVEAMLAAFDTYADQVGPALSGHWT